MSRGDASMNGAPWWAPARLPFLWLTPCCMALGVAGSWWLAQRSGMAWSWFDAALACLGALLAHISVNALNEYADFRSGLDAQTIRTPFSGGSGTLPGRPELAGATLGMGLFTLSLCALIGLYFLWTEPGVWRPLLPIGLVGLALVVAYTPWVTRQPWLCLVAPGLGFGPLMMIGVGAVLLHEVAWPLALLSLLPFGLVNNLLLLNQFPDVDADRAVGRNTLPMRLGRSRCWPVMLGQFTLAYAALMLAIAAGSLPRAAALGLLTLPLALNVVRGARLHADNIAKLLPFMGMNVVVSLLTPVLAAIGIVLGA